MVTINTYTTSITIKQVIDIENSPYVVITSSHFGEPLTNCCLLHCRRGRIYSREVNGWSCIKDPYYCGEIRKIVLQALNNEQIPKFSTDLFGLNSILN